MTDNSNQPEQEGTTPTKPQSRRSLRIVLIIVGLAVLLGGIWWYYRHVTYGQYMQSTDNAYVAADSAANTVSASWLSARCVKPRRSDASTIARIAWPRTRRTSPPSTRGAA